MEDIACAQTVEHLHLFDRDFQSGAILVGQNRLIGAGNGDIVDAVFAHGRKEFFAVIAVASW